MADVRVAQPHSLSPDEAKERMADFEDMMKKYGVSAMLAKAAGIDPVRLQNSISRRLKEAFEAG